MSKEKEDLKNDKVEEPTVEYEVQKPQFKGINRETFDFDAEFANGFTLEEAKPESIRKIREWWGNENYKVQNSRRDFDTEFANGLTPEEFKAEISKRIKAYPWRK